MNNTAVRIEGTMTTSKQQELHVVKERMSVPVSVDGNYYTINTSISRQRYETYKSLVKAKGMSVSAVTAELIDKYITEHVDEIIMLRDLRERL